jgi:hypothetical protein
LGWFFERLQSPMFLDCFTWIINPIQFKELDPDDPENRNRSPIQLLKQALP